MSTAEAREILKKNPLSFVRVSRAEADLPEGIAETDPQVYAKGRETWKTTLQRPAETGSPALLLYLPAADGGYIQIGLVALWLP